MKILQKLFENHEKFSLGILPLTNSEVSNSSSYDMFSGNCLGYCLKTICRRFTSFFIFNWFFQMSRKYDFTFGFQAFKKFFGFFWKFFRELYENSSRRYSTSKSSFSKSYGNCAKRCIWNFSRRSIEIITKSCCRHYSNLFPLFPEVYQGILAEVPPRIFPENIPGGLLELRQDFFQGVFQVTLPGVWQIFYQQ